MSINKKYIVAGVVVLDIILIAAVLLFIFSTLKRSDDLNDKVTYTSTGRCQWNIGGTPMNFENVFSFKITEAKGGDRVQYVFTMHNGKIHRFHTGTQFAVQDIVNEVRVCTQGKAFGHNLLY